MFLGDIPVKKQFIVFKTVSSGGSDKYVAYMSVPSTTFENLAYAPTCDLIFKISTRLFRLLTYPFLTI